MLLPRLLFRIEEGQAEARRIGQVLRGSASIDFDRLLVSTVAQPEWTTNYLRGFNLTVTRDHSATLINKLLAGKPLAEFVDVKNGMKPYCTGNGDPLQIKEMAKAHQYDADRQVSPATLMGPPGPKFCQGGFQWSSQRCW